MKKKMYVTRPLYQLLRTPESLTAQPEGPNSGYLVIQDQESETYSCFGLCKNRTVKQLPFPQNKELTVRYETRFGENSYVSLHLVFLIPLLNQPLSSNLSYIIVAHGRHKGCVKYIKPRPLEPNNIYQQFRIHPCEGLCSRSGTFFANSVVADGFPSYSLRRKGWTILTKTPYDFNLQTAQGIESKLRASFPGSALSESCVVGKGYCPFIFVKEGTSLKDHMKKSMYYEVTLEQRVEQIFTCNKNNYDHNSVVTDTSIGKEETFVGGIPAMWTKQNAVVSFNSCGGGGEEMSVGLRREIVERMKWK